MMDSEIFWVLKVSLKFFNGISEAGFIGIGA